MDFHETTAADRDTIFYHAQKKKKKEGQFSPEKKGKWSL